MDYLLRIDEKERVTLQRALTLAESFNKSRRDVERSYGASGTLVFWKDELARIAALRMSLNTMEAITISIVSATEVEIALTNDGDGVSGGD